MGIFDNYQNLDNAYVPNNLSSSFPIKKPCYAPIIQRPYEEYNAEGELIGYYWHYGDTISLEFNLTGEITVYNNDIIYSAINQAPTEETQGVIGQKAYNIVDFISWTLTSIYGDKYIWVEDEYFVYPKDGNRDVYFTIEDFLKDKYIKIELFNFRYKKIFEKVFPGSQTIVLGIDENLSEMLIKGVYYCRLSVFDDFGACITPEGITTLTLTVK